LTAAARHSSIHDRTGEKLNTFLVLHYSQPAPTDFLLQITHTFLLLGALRSLHYPRDLFNTQSNTLDMNHWPSVELPGVNQIIDDADDRDAAEHRDAPIPVRLSAIFPGRHPGKDRNQENQGTHIDFPSTLAKSGKKLITVENSSNSSATTLIGTAQRPSDQRAGGNGSPYNRRQRTQAMLSA
jgi:hypothetical protein